LARDSNSRGREIALVAGGLAVTLALVFAQTARADETVTTCGGYANQIFAPSSAYGMNVNDTCPGGSLSISTTGFSYKRGQGAIWQTSAPAGLTIVGASVPPGDLYSNYVGSYGGNFYWAGGKSNITIEPGVSLGPFSSHYFGFLLVCTGSTCGPGAQLYVDQISLAVHETSGPWLSSTGLWQAAGWVRGSWTLNYWGDSPSGLCGINGDFAGQALPGSTSLRAPSTWHECAAAPVSDYVNTADYGQGAQTIRIGAWDAAGVVVNYTKTVYVDNQQPAVSLSGPTNAPSTAGTQYVLATASAGPSGVAGISCSVDGAPSHWFASSTARLPVAGIGQHSVTCSAASNAVDGSGNHGWSAPQTRAMKIGVPTVTGIAFSRIVNRLRCRAVRERLRVPVHWVTVRRHRHRIRVHRRGHTELVRVVKCHDRTVLRRRTVWITAHRHGKKVRVRRHRTVRIIAPPHAVLKTHRLVDHGRATTVSGWLGTYNGVALNRQTVEVLTAPDNGSDSFTPVARVMTATNGSWSARLPAGPSRLIEAAYVGGPTVEGSLSGTVREIVPARVRLLRVVPRRVPWGGTVRIVGQLVGGYLPRGGALVRLRLGSGSSYTTYGVQEHVAGKGRFSTRYTFGAGQASSYQRFWFQISSLPMGSYPYSPSASGRRSVLVGGHPVIPHHRHRARRRK